MVLQDRILSSVIADRYEVSALIGTGGWSRVYKGYQASLERHVAIKVLHAHLAEDAEHIVRFQREAEAASRLHHPNIAAIYDYGVLPDGQPYIVMELLEGKSLAEVLDEDVRLSGQRALPLLLQVCDALSYAHSQGILHRDLKPANVAITRDINGVEAAKVLDFGLAKLISKTEGDHNNSLTDTGQTVGTPKYMSPEQCRGITVDRRSDVYSMGCLMYEVFTGNKAISGDTMYDIMHAHLVAEPAPFDSVGKLDIPCGFEGIVYKAMAKDPAGRFQTMDELKTALLEMAGKQAWFKRVYHRVFFRCPMVARVRAFRQRKIHWSTAAAACLLIVLSVVLTSMILQKLQHLPQTETEKAPLQQAALPSEPKGPKMGPQGLILDENMPVTERIKICEDWLKTHPGYDYMVLNQLRHMYGAIDENKMMEYTNEILKHSPMDGYQVSILSGWLIESNYKDAIAKLLYNAESYTQCKYVNAACTLAVGELYAKNKHKAKACTYLKKVATTSDPELVRYRKLAEIDLRLL